MLEVDSLEVKVLWTLIMVVLYCMLPGAYAVSIDQFIRVIMVLDQVIAASVGRAFGPEYFAPNFGLFFTATVAYFTIIIIVSQVSQI